MQTFGVCHCVAVRHRRMSIMGLKLFLNKRNRNTVSADKMWGLSNQQMFSHIRIYQKLLTIL